MAFNKTKWKKKIDAMDHKFGIKALLIFIFIFIYVFR